MRTVAAWAVAYLVLLQTLLTGVALAAMPLGPDGTLCLSASETARSGAGDLPDRGDRAHVHCQACLARAETPVLPPVPAPVPQRTTVVAAYSVPAAPAGRRDHLRLPFQPRGPPTSLAPVSA